MPQNTTPLWTEKLGHPKPPARNAFPGMQATGLAPGPAISEEHKARQRDEVDAIRSIYMDAFEEMPSKATAWSVSRYNYLAPDQSDSFH